MEVFNFQDVCSSAVKRVVTSCSAASPSVDFNFGSDPEEGRCRTTSTERVLGQLKLLFSGWTCTLMHFGIYVETREAWRTEGDTVRTMKTKVKSSVFMSARETQRQRRWDYSSWITDWISASHRRSLCNLRLCSDFCVKWHFLLLSGDRQTNRAAAKWRLLMDSYRLYKIAASLQAQFDPESSDQCCHTTVNICYIP